MELPSIFLEYASLYRAHGFHLYLVGGTSRDLLLGLEPADLDFATDATPEEEASFLKDINSAFAKWGSIQIRHGGQTIDVTTFREEGEYRDYRHPSSVTFVRDPERDSYRRDFTVNALYVDDRGEVLDFHGGLEDLRSATLRLIGDPDRRLQEDPLRILRARRFAKRFGFHFEEQTRLALERNAPLLEKLNPEKVKMERMKD